MAKLLIIAIFALLIWTSAGSSLSDAYVRYTPTIFNHSASVSLTNGGFPITLTYAAEDSSQPYVVLDYAVNVGGYPFMEISAVNGEPTVRQSYAEALPNLIDGDLNFFPLIRAFNPSRVVSRQIKSAGHYEDFMVQGAQRYHRISLTSPGSVTITAVGIRSAHYSANIEQAPVTFSCSNPVYDEMWTMSIRTLQLNMVPPRMIRPGFQATNQGFVIGPNQAGLILRGMQWVNYVTTFSAMILENGFSFAIRSNDYSEIVITIHSEQSSTPNAITALTRTELPPPDSLFFEATLPFSVAERTWHEIEASVNELTILLSINDELVANISIPPSSNPFIPSITPGGVGYTTSVDQQVIVRYLTVKEFTTDNVLYQDPLTSEEAVRDFGVGTNELPLILDGAKRDRNVWAGDLLVAGPALYYSNFETQYAAGSIAICNSYQLATGQVSSRINVGFPLQPNVPSADFVTPIFYSYTYFLSNVIVAADYYLFTAHAQFVQEQFPILQRVMDSFAPMVDDTGLINAQSYVWGYDFVPGFGVFIGHVTKMNLLYAMALDASAVMADVVSNTTLASEYRAQAASVRTAINTHLYNSTTNTYYVSDQSTSTMLQDVNAFAILAGTIQGDNASALLDTMKETLRLDDGYLVAYPPSAPFFPVISPFSSFFHAQAAFDTDRSDLAFDVIDQVWSQMVEKGDYYTGTFWEMRSVDEYPEPSTSMAHAWAAGPAVLLSKYVLGVQPTSPGYSTWLVRPQPEKLTWAAGAVNTPHGIMDIKWNTTESLFSVWIDVPRHTSGTVSLPRSSECISVNNVAYSLGTHNKSGVGSVEANKDRVAVTLTTSGTYTIASHATCTPAASSPVAVTPQAGSSASHLSGALGLFALLAACLV